LFDWSIQCECGWEKSYRNPVAAQWGGESHLSRCPYFQEATRIVAKLRKGNRFHKMIDRDKYFQGGNFLKAKDFKDGQQVIVTQFEEVKTRIGTRPVLRLQGFEAPLGLNATNMDKMIEKYGNNEKTWAGKRIRISIIMAPNPSKGGKEGPAVRIE
jgi:hypothetical protein